MEEQPSGRPLTAAVVTLIGAVLAACSGFACDSPAALTQLLEARRLASDLHVEFTKSAEASNRAVMSETEDGAGAAAEEARRARQVVERDVEALQAILQSPGYRDDLRHLDGFKVGWDEYRRIDDEILTLAVENTNLKAQRLSFGAAREAADVFRTSVDAACRANAATQDTFRAEALAGRAGAAVLEILVLQAPHIAEPEDAEMTRLEKLMAASAEQARRALDELKAVVTPAAAPQLAAAGAALDRFMSVNADLVKLSRRNSDVRSLALSLGRKRAATVKCEDLLRTLDQSLAGHRFNATR